MKRILFLALAGIGDSLLTTPTLTHLKKVYPSSRITVLVMYNESYLLFKRHKHVDEVIFFDFMKQGYFNSLLFVMKMRKRKYDFSIMAYPSNRLRPNVISLLLGGKKRLSHLYDINRISSLNFLYTCRLPLDAHTHVIDENLRLLTLLGIDVQQASRRLILPLLREEQHYATAFFKKNEIRSTDVVVGLHPGSSILAGMTYKRWPKERFAAVADKLAQKHKAKILLFGGKNEHSLHREISRLMKHTPLSVETPSLFHTAAIIGGCDVFLSNDTLLMHFASHLKVPTVVVSGHINPSKTRPLHHQSLYLSAPYPCRRYHIGENLTCRYAGTPRYCLNQLSVNDVYDAMESVLH
jgi:heptosyltransferase II